jgi:hypothetical protein
MYYPTPATPPKPLKPPLETRAVDRIFVIIVFALGFLFWEWLVPHGDSDPSLGAFLFIISAATATLIWMTARGIRQNAKSLTAFAIVIVGALPFVLFDLLPIYIFLFAFEIVASLIWICFSCRTEISKEFSGFIFFDAINQAFVVPFANLGTIFGTIKSAVGTRGGGRPLLIAILGIVCALPIIVAIIALLISADDGFRQAMSKVLELFNWNIIGRYLWQFTLGVPVAIYMFGHIYGNQTHRNTDKIKNESAHAFVDKAHVIPSAAIYAPLIILCIIYITFFGAMADYMISGFKGDVPKDFIYSEYARRGFFELCVVAAINLFLLGIAWLLSKRQTGGHPIALRIIGGIITGLTLLLIAAAASKMILYIDAYGLTRLRLYTMWFMLVLACIFIVLLIWHVHPFNAGRPIVLAVVLLVLALFLSNSDGLIAKYNVENYLNGNLKSVDTEMLESLSGEAAPWIAKLRDAA